MRNLIDLDNEGSPPKRIEGGLSKLIKREQPRYHEDAFHLR